MSRTSQAIAVSVLVGANQSIGPYMQKISTAIALAKTLKINKKPHNL